MKGKHTESLKDKEYFPGLELVNALWFQHKEQFCILTGSSAITDHDKVRDTGHLIPEYVMVIGLSDNKLFKIGRPRSGSPISLSRV